MELLPKRALADGGSFIGPPVLPAKPPRLRPPTCRGGRETTVAAGHSDRASRSSPSPLRGRVPARPIKRRGQRTVLGAPLARPGQHGFTGPPRLDRARVAGLAVGVGPAPSVAAAASARHTPTYRALTARAFSPVGAGRMSHSPIHDRAPHGSARPPAPVATPGLTRQPAANTLCWPLDGAKRAASPGRPRSSAQYAHVAVVSSDPRAGPAVSTASAWTRCAACWRQCPLGRPSRRRIGHGAPIPPPAVLSSAQAGGHRRRS